MALFSSSSGDGEVHSPLVVVEVFTSPEDGSGITRMGATWCTETADEAAAAIMAAQPEDEVGRVKRSALDTVAWPQGFEPETLEEVAQPICRVFLYGCSKHIYSFGLKRQAIITVALMEIQVDRLAIWI